MKKSAALSGNGQALSTPYIMEPTTEHRTLNTEYLQSSANLCTTHPQPPTSRIRHPASRIANRPTPTYPDRSRPTQSHPDRSGLQSKSVVASGPRLCRGGQPQQHMQPRPPGTACSGTGWDGCWDGLGLKKTQCPCCLGRRDGLKPLASHLPSSTIGQYQ